MNTRPLIIPSEQLLAMAANLPADAKVETAGPTTGTERGKVDGVYARISSEKFRPEDQDKPIELKGNEG